jgi:pimeloyl-ACP methyl ester carboxylesterase
LATFTGYKSRPFRSVDNSKLTIEKSEIIYKPNDPPGARDHVPNPSDVGLTDWDEVRLSTPDGLRLHGYYIRAPAGPTARNITLLRFHGAMGNTGHQLPQAKVFAEDLGFDVYLPEYRGYGYSTGRPDEKGINIDAQTAFDYLRQRPASQQKKIIVLGESLGGAIGVQLVAKHQDNVEALILDSTFLSIPKVAREYV